MEASIIGCSGDLLPLILIHLPPKTLVRLKLVSKQWKFLISNPQFGVNHSRNNSSSVGIFLYHPSPNTHILSVPPLSSFVDELLPPDFTYSHRAFQSCNGLLLCLFFNDDIYNAKFVCVICNPTTRDFRVLPRPPLSETNDGLTLVFNPSESHHYKVVICIKRSGVMGAAALGGELYIYSSETNRWKFLRSINLIVPYLPFRRGVFSNGAVFWQGSSHTYYYNLKSNENVGVLRVPVNLPLPIHHYFSESCGRVFLAVAARFGRSRYEIFELDRVGMKWSKCHLNSSSSQHFRDEHFGDYTRCQITSVMAVAVSTSEEEDDIWDLVVSLTMPDRLIIVNSSVGRHVQNCYVERNIYEYQSCEYVPSLVPFVFFK